MNQKLQLPVKLASFLILIALLAAPGVGWGQTLPSAFDLSSGNYSFTSWAASSTAGTYPSNMYFHRTGTQDPGLAVEMTTNYTTAYNLTSGTRINGMDADGITFVNTGTSGNLGAAVVGLNTTGRTNIQVSWLGGTHTQTDNNRVYAIRLQYRIGAGSWTDVSGPVEYSSSGQTVGHTTSFGPTTLPAGCENQATVYLRWKYYSISGSGGTRPRLRLDEISVTSSGSAATPPTLTADATNNNVDNDIDITFTDDATWRAAVTAVKIGGTSLTVTTDYELAAGNLKLKPSGGNTLLTTSGSKSVTVEATGYNTTSVTQQINAGAPTANSTASISSPLGAGTTRTVTCTARDQYNNVVSGYTFKFDLVTLDSDLTTDESYTVDGTAYTADAGNVDLASATNASGISTFDITIPALVDGNDGVMIQVQLANGTTDIGDSFDYIKTPAQITLTGTDPGSASFQLGTSYNVLYRIAVAVSNDVANLSELEWITNGTYLAADIPANGFKLWYSADASFGGDSQLASVSSVSTGSGEILSFSGFNQQFAIGTAYLFITTDISASATVGNTISGEATANGDFTFSGGASFSGSTFGSGNLHTIAAGPSVLQAGDIAFIGYATDSPDRFAFITFVDINANTQITFTDNGWRADNTWRSNENSGTWTAPASGIPAGSIIQIEGTTVTGGGTMSAGLTGLSGDGDQVIAYQGTSGSPSFISAINMDWGVWQADATNSNTSALPTGLTNNVNANAVTQENGYYSGPTNGTINFLRAAINNPANWVTTNDNSGQTWPSWSFNFGSSTTLSSSVTLLNLTVDAGESLTITDGASLITNGTVTGTATVQKNISDSDFHLFTLPVNQPLPASPTFIGFYVDDYIEANGAWTRMVDADNLQPLRGYSISNESGALSLDFSGPLFTGDQTFSNLSYTPAAGGYLYGWNLVGNPFPSAVDPDVAPFVTNGLNGFAYVWSGSLGNYLTAPLTGGAGTLTGNIIPSAQGFFVRTEAAGANLTIPNAARVHSTQSFYKNNETFENTIMLTASGNEAEDRMMFAVNPESTAGYDYNFDAYKLFGNAEAPQLYTSILDINQDIINLSISSVDVIEAETEFPVMFKAGVDGNYTITSSYPESFMSGSQIILTDNLTGLRHDLRQNPVYAFSAAAGDDANRFKLSFATVGIEEPSGLNIGVYAAGNQIRLVLPELMKGRVNISNLAGQLLYSQNFNGSGELGIGASYPAGVYLVTVISANGSTTRKVFVN